MKIQFEKETIPTNKFSKALEDTNSIIVLKCDI